MSIDKVKAEFRKEFDDNILCAIREAISNAYNFVYSASRSQAYLQGRTGSEIIPQVRKAVVDSHLKLMTSLGLGVVVREVPNEIFNSWHVEVRVGRFIATHNFVHNCSEHPRDSEFRKNLLLNNQQLSMYDEGKNVLRAIREIQENTSEIIYSQIIHGGDGRDPSFLRLCLPNHDGSEWLDIIKIPILKSETPAEVIPETNLPPLKEERKKQGFSNDSA